jgi:signal transduction histidine kinase
VLFCTVNWRLNPYSLDISAQHPANAPAFAVGGSVRSVLLEAVVSTDFRTVQPDPRLGSFLLSIAHVGSISVMLVGGLILVGWAFDIAPLQSLFQGPLTTKGNAAVALMVAGLSLRLALIHPSRPSLRAAQQIAAAAVALIGILTVAQDLTGVNIGIDLLLFTEGEDTFGTGSPGRMSPNTAVMLALFGIALWRIDRRPREGVHRAEAPALAAALIAGLGLLGHAYGETGLLAIAAATQMALPTAGASAVLAVSILFARPTAGLMAVITDRGVVGVLIRRLLPVALLAPPTLGLVGLVGERAGLYGAAFGAVLVAVGNMTALGVTAWAIVRALIRADNQRQVAETALVKAELFQRAIFDSPTFSSIATDAKGVIQVFNVGAERMLGYTAAEVVNIITPADISDPDELVARAQALTVELHTPISSGFDALAFKAARGIEDIYELTYIRKDGKRVPAVVSVTVLRDASLTIIGYLLIGTDNTARKLVEVERQRLEQLLRDQNQKLEEAGRALEAQLTHSNKMGALGQLAAGVAHDFNNLLTVILGFSEVFAADEALSDVQRRDVNEITSAAQRASELTKQLLAFSRHHAPNTSPLDLNVLVTNMAGMLDRLIGAQITTSVTLAPSLPAVVADRGQMEQVVMNLVVNARDAMPEGGCITITTDVADITGMVLGDGTLAAGAWVRLVLADSGCGMSEETRAHLFEPFFTTKAVGKGTGLGLSTVAGIVRQARGHIVVDSVVGRGTTFTVYLPAAAAHL